MSRLWEVTLLLFDPMFRLRMASLAQKAGVSLADGRAGSWRSLRHRSLLPEHRPLDARAKAARRGAEPLIAVFLKPASVVSGILS